MLELLRESPRPVGELVARTGLTQPGTSKHLRDQLTHGPRRFAQELEHRAAVGIGKYGPGGRHDD